MAPSKTISSFWISVWLTILYAPPNDHLTQFNLLYQSSRILEFPFPLSPSTPTGQNCNWTAAIQPSKLCMRNPKRTSENNTKSVTITKGTPPSGIATQHFGVSK